MKLKQKINLLATYGFGHLFIDFMCAFALGHIIFRNIISPEIGGTYFLLYNIIAFGIQPFIGYLFDKNKQPKYAAMLGLMFAFVGFLYFRSPLTSVIMLGIGNALYHIGGGLIALNIDPGKATYPGMYVAPGAIGVFIGGILGYLQFNLFSTYFFVGAITTFLIITILILNTPKIKKYKKASFPFVEAILLLLLTSVAMRALIGYSLQIGWKSIPILGTSLVLSIVLGKFFGGILGDRYGFMKTGLLGLVLATILLVFFQNAPVLVFIGAFAFNLVMPITLTAIANTIPNYKGLAFGLTTLALMFGYLIFIFLDKTNIDKLYFTIIFLAINILALYYGLKKYEKVVK